MPNKDEFLLRTKQGSVVQAVDWLLLGEVVTKGEGKTVYFLTTTRFGLCAQTVGVVNKTIRNVVLSGADLLYDDWRLAEKLYPDA